MSNVKKAFLVNQVKERKWICWRVYQQDGKTLISMQNEPDISPEDSSQLLADQLNNTVGHVVVITSCEPFEEGLKYMKAGKHFTSRVNCSDGDNLSSNQRNTVNGIPIEQYLGSVQEITNLKMELLKKEMESNSNSPALRIAEKLVDNENFINGITNFLTASLMPKGKPISGPVPTLSASLEEFKKIDPDAEETLAGLINYIKKNPEQFQQFKNLVLGK